MDRRTKRLVREYIEEKKVEKQKRYNVWLSKNDGKYYWQLLDPEDDNISDDNIAGSSGGFETIEECLYELDLARIPHIPIYEQNKDRVTIFKIRIYADKTWKRLPIS